jgi:hypothetical protein
MPYLQCLFTYIYIYIYLYTETVYFTSAGRNHATRQETFCFFLVCVQPSADAYINKEQYEVMDGAFDPEAGITTVAETQDDVLPHAAA